MSRLEFSSTAGSSKDAQVQVVKVQLCGRQRVDPNAAYCSTFYRNAKKHISGINNPKGWEDMRQDKGTNDNEAKEKTGGKYGRCNSGIMRQAK